MLLATIGYEGLTQAKLFEILVNQGVETIVDVRELPISRKPGFSKKALINSAQTYRLGYVHFGSLGSPRDVRHTYRADKDWNCFIKKYQSHLNAQVSDLNKLSQLMALEYCCLLCFEANHLMCHRSLVTNKLKSLIGPELEIKHLGIDSKAAVAWPIPSVGIPIRR